MFKPIQIILLSLFFILISGCANHNAIAVNNKNNTPDTAIKNVKATTNVKSSIDAKTNTLVDKPVNTFTPKASTFIKAGLSNSGANGFITATNDLKPDILMYALEVSETKRLPQAQVIQLIKSANYNEKVARLMTPAKTRIKKSWLTYKKRFVEPIRIKAGLEYWRDNYTTLEKIQEQYGVDAAIIVAIIGVETIYGRYTGDFKILDALATLGFRYPDESRPERAQMFRNQLADFIDLHFQQKIDANSATGSYAGAMGLPQFMPTSIMNYAVDGNHDGIIDLRNNNEDAIASVANFLRHHGWVPNLPVFVNAGLPKDANRFVTGDINPNYSWSYLSENGFSTNVTSQWQQHLLGIIDLVDEPSNTVEYKLATPNFFAITHYNRSYFYAGSVYELAKALREQF